MNPLPSTKQALREEIAGLRERLAQAGETLAAIRHGEVDALVVESATGPQVYTLQGLDAEQNRLRGEMLAQVNDAVIALDHEQRLIYANAAAERRYDFTTSRMLGRPLKEIYQREWPRHGAEAEMMETLSACGAWTGELAHVTRGGTRIDVEISMTVMRDNAGDASGFLSVSRDVTGRKRMERELAANERRFRALLENSAEDIILLDAAGRIVYESPHRVPLLGFAPGEMTGRDCFELVHPEDLDAARRDLGGMLDARPGTHVTGEIRMRRKEGGWSWIHYHGGNLLHDPAVAALVLNLRDITGRKQAEAELVRTKTQLATLLETAPVGFCHLDRDLRFLMINDRLAEMNGVSVADTLGKTVAEVVPALVPAVQGVTSRILATGEAVAGHEFIGETPLQPGVTRYWSENWYPVRDDNDAITGFGVIVEEITPRKLAEAAAQQGLQTLAELIERSPFGTYIVDAQFHIAMMNTSSQEGAFRNVLPVIGRPFDEAMRILWPAPVAAEIIAHFRHTLDTGEPYFSRDFINPRHDAEIVEAYEWELHRMTLPDGQHGVICYYYDWTKLRQTEAALRESEQRLRLALDAARAAAWETNLATGQNAWDERMARLLGVPAKEAAASQQRWLEFVHPDDRARVAAAFAGASGHGGPPHDVEFRVRSADGTERWFLSMGMRVVAPDGTARMLGVVQDITERKQAEDALRASEERYRGLVGVLPTAVYTCDVEGRITFFNERAAEFWGRRPQPGDTDERFCGSFRLWLPDGRPLPHDRTPMARAIREGAGFRGEEVVIERPDGQRIPVLVNIDALRDAGGRITGAINAFTDITERKRAELALRESEEKYRNLFANMAEEVHYWQLVRDEAGNIQTWRLVDANPPALKSWGRQSVEEIRGLTTDEIFGPGATEHYLPVVRKIMSEGVAHTFENFFPNLDKHFRFTSVPFGEFFITTGADITDIKKSEAALRQSREDLAHAQEVGQIGSWRLDVARNVLTWSDENHRIFGVPKGTPLTYERFLNIVHPADRDYVDAQWNAALRGEPYDIEHRILVDGKVKWVREKAYLEFDGAGGLSGGFGITQDITTRKRTEEEMRESFTKTEKAEDELRKLNESLEERVLERTAEVRQLADRLRALASELTLSEHRERKHLAQTLHDGLQQILVASRIRLTGLSHARNKEVRQCAQQVDDLLAESIELSRSLTADLSPPILHEGGLVPALEWLTRSVLLNQGLEVKLETHAELAPTAEDLNILLFLAVRELLFNIVKHAGVKTARVRMAKRDGMIELTVSDQGAGFDPEQVFKRNGNSGGFGLFSIRERLGLMGGNLEIHSAAGRGSHFVLLAPLPESAGPPPVPLKRPGKTSVTNTRRRSKVRKIRVMLVDDHLVMRQGLGFLIREERDLDVVGEAADGESAVRLAREIHPDVILMDVSMPGMNGLEATRIIHAECPEIQIIGLSMFEEAERAGAMREAGAVKYLNKSGPSQELIAAIRTCMKEGLPKFEGSYRATSGLWRRMR